MSLEKVTNTVQEAQAKVSLGMSRLRLAIECIEDAHEGFGQATIDSPSQHVVDSLHGYARTIRTMRDMVPELRRFDPACEWYLVALGAISTRSNPYIPPAPSFQSPEKIDMSRITAWRDRVHDAAKQGKSIRTMPGFIGAGLRSYVFELDDQHCAKIANVENAGSWLNVTDSRGKPLFTSDKAARDDSAEALRRGRGEPGLEQLVDHDEDNSIIVVKRAAGKTAKRMTPGELAAIPPARYHELLELGERMRSQLRIDIDANPGNVLYDPQKGFTVIDYHTIESTRRLYQRRSAAEQAQLLSPEELALELADPRNGPFRVDDGTPNWTSTKSIAPAHLLTLWDVVKARYGSAAAQRIQDNLNIKYRMP